MRTVDINPKVREILGLSETENRVFEVLLNRPLGIRVVNVIKETGLPRMTIYDILKRFQKRKIVEVITLRRSHFWKCWAGLEYIGKRIVSKR